METIFRKWVLLSKITWKRKEMHRKANHFGLTDQRTVTCSQELDSLLNVYQGIQPKSRRSLLSVIREF
ncbi:Spo0E family sporulation regulatory protein-aspartic acid phosphatase [Alteribacillus sp. JSM 102045]|uniref:Spo0E family sporulation regulatory protein-aspartic acid phosphatase n=1 Tax=Alteribacillus sp. JSM 102045 TaxID=1562101 RepID=UPI0035C1D8A2